MKSFGLKELAEHYFATESEVTDYVAASDYEKLKAERDALAAQVETLLTAIDYVISGRGDYTDLSEAMESTPAQCLSDIKAEAARAGFIEGGYMWSDYTGKSQHKLDYLIDIEADAAEYAAKIRNGEIK